MNPSDSRRQPLRFRFLSHMLLDGIMHADLQPFVPFTASNTFLGIFSVEVLHDFCLYSWLVGAGLYYTISQWIARR